jgi:hypothetical protein
VHVAALASPTFSAEAEVTDAPQLEPLVSLLILKRSIGADRVVVRRSG